MSKVKRRARPQPKSIKNRCGPAGKGTRMERENVTPERAEEWLTHNTNNRPCPETRVMRLAEAILNGEWQENGETIKFNCKGDLVDGQGRLKAIVRAQRAVVCWIAYGVPEDAFDTIDQGRSRSISDVFARNDINHFVHMAGAVTLLYKLDETIPSEPGGLRAAVALSIVAERPQLIESARKVYKAGLSSVTSVGMAICLYYLMALKDPDATESFWAGIREGITGKRNPVRVLRDTLLRNRGENRKLSPTMICALTIKAWVLVRQGRSCTFLRWNPEKEAFPVII